MDKIVSLPSKKPNINYLLLFPYEIKGVSVGYILEPHAFRPVNVINQYILRILLHFPDESDYHG
jgi:hypothetical protein